MSNHQADQSRQRCPMLGVPGNSSKHYVYPFGGNVCYACPAGVWKYGAVSEDRQQEHCLSGKHEGCPSYRKCLAGEPAAMKPSTWFERAATLWRTRASQAEREMMVGAGMVLFEPGKTD